MLRQRTSF